MCLPATGLPGLDQVHASNEFVIYSSVGATLYWAFAKLLAREYEQAYAAIGSCGTDMRLRHDEAFMVRLFQCTTDDKHPDAHACRVKLRLVLLHSPPMPPDNECWPKLDDFTDEFCCYLTKRSHVSMACRLSYAEEVRAAASGL